MLISANPSRAKKAAKPQAAWSYEINAASLAAFDHAFPNLDMRDRWNFALALGLAVVDPSHLSEAQGVCARDVMSKTGLDVLYAADAETVYSQLVEKCPSFKTDKLQTRPVRLDPEILRDFRGAAGEQKRNVDLNFALCNATAAALAHILKTGRALLVNPADGLYGVTPELIQALTASKSVAAAVVARVATRFTAPRLEACKPGLSTLVAMGASTAAQLAAFITETETTPSLSLELPALDF